MLLRTGSPPDESPPVRALIGMIRDQFTRNYLGRYLSGSELSEAEVDRWYPVILAARLSEGAPRGTLAQHWLPVAAPNAYGNSRYVHYWGLTNTNEDAGQTVFHIHLHLLGGRRLGWPPG